MIDLDTLATALERRTTLAWCIEHVPADGDVDAVIARAWRGRVRRKTTDDYEAMSTLLVSAGRLTEVRAAEGKAPLWATERVWTAYLRSVARKLAALRPPTFAELRGAR
jgi:hypothetical protein